MSSVRLTFNSSYFTNQSPENLTVNFSNPIYLPSLNYEVALVRLFTFNAHYNVTSAKSNNVFRYSHDSGSSWQNITLDDGIYSVTEINTAIQRAMKANGHSGTDASGEDVFYITITPNYTTGKNEITQESTYRCDFTVASSMRSLLGFNSRIVTATSDEGDFVGDINAGVVAWLVDCSLVSGSYQNGDVSNTLFTFTPAVPSYGIVASEPINLSFTQISTKTIDRVTLRLLDQDGNQLDLNGENIVYELLIRPIRI